jgi:arylsulfatase A-like enzyme
VRREGGPAYAGKTIEALRRGRWKLVQDSPFAPAALYDLEADPRETKDLAGTERQVFAELSSALQEHIRQGGRTPWQPPAR